MKADFNKLYVSVTQKDIREGQVGKCSACPIALAIYRLFHKPNEVEVMVGLSQMSIMLNGSRIRYMPSPEATSFVQHFDAGLPVHPTNLVFTKRI